MNPSGTGLFSLPVVTGTPCQASLSYVQDAGVAHVVAGASGTEAVLVGKLFLGCPVQTNGATVTAEVSSTTLDLCRVPTAHSTLTVPNDLTQGVDVYMENIASDGDVLRVGGGACTFTFSPGSVADTAATGYSNAADLTGETVTAIKQSSLVLSSTILALTSGCDAGAADTSITVKSCAGGVADCPVQNIPTGMSLQMTSSDTSICTVPTDPITVVSANDKTIALSITPVSTGTCVVSVSVTSSSSSSKEYIPPWAPAIGTVTVTVTGSKTMSPAITNWDVKYLQCGDDIKFDITAKNVQNKWISFGWSSTSKMSLTDAIICSPGSGVIQRHWMPGYTPDAGVNLVKASTATCSSDGTHTSMSFRRPLTTSNSKQITIVNGKEVSVLWAVGNSDSVNLNVPHSSRGHVNAKFEVSSGGDGGGDDASTTKAPSPGTKKEDQGALALLEKELRVEGLNKFDTLDPEQKMGMTWTLTDDAVEMAIKVKGFNAGWISVAFPATPGLMKDADAISGDASGVKAWKLSARDIASEKTKEYLTSSSVEIVGEYMTVRFKVKATSAASRRLYATVVRSLASHSTDVSVSAADVSTPLLWSMYSGTGSFAKGVIHTKRGSAAVNLKSGGNGAAKAPTSALPPTELNDQQKLISLVIILAFLLVILVMGVIVNKLDTCDCLTQRSCTMPFLVTLKLGEWGVWLLYFAAVTIFFAYRLGTVPTVYEAQRSMGWVACWTGFIAAFPSLQSTMLVHLFGIPFERSIKHHRMAGRWFWLFQTVHLIIALTYIDLGTLISTYDAPTAPLKVVYGYGFLAWLSCTLIVITALSQVRRKAWEVFYYTHVILTKVCYLFGLLHLQGSLLGMILMGLPLVVWVGEWMIRSCGPKSHQSKKSFVVLKAKTDDSTTHLVLQTNNVLFQQPGDYCFLSFPQISALERHPFSIAACPGGTKMEFRMKNMGGSTFTGRLHNHVKNNVMKAEDLDVKMTGPYGKISVKLERYTNIVLCAGGIGVTPMISTLHWLFDQSKESKLPNLKNVLFIWTVRYEKQLIWCNEVLSKLATLPAIFQVQLYVTRPSKTASGGGGTSGGAANAAGSAGNIEMINIKDKGRISPIHMHWESLVDEKTGNTYYHNKATDETTWVKPAEMDSTTLNVVLQSPLSSLPPTGEVSSAEKVVDEAPAEWIKGRPNFEKILIEYPTDGTCVLACGPTPMVKDVEGKASAKAMHFHKEIFSF